MSHYTDDKCSACGNHCSPELLTIVRVQFINKASKKVIKSRSTKWVCESCRDSDEDWNAQAYSGPGNKSAPLENVRRAREQAAASGTV